MNAPRVARPAWRSPRAWLTLVAVFALGLTIDLTTKAWSFEAAVGAPVVLDRARLLDEPAHDPVRGAFVRSLVPGLLDLRPVLNPGAVFGIGAHQRWFFIAFTFAAMAGGILLFALRTTARRRLAHVAIALVLAGGLGNLHDRIAYGRVRDFLHALPGRELPNDWTWPGTNNPEMFPWVFNVADTLLLAGMLGLVVESRRRTAREPETRDGA